MVNEKTKQEIEQELMFFMKQNESLRQAVKDLERETATLKGVNTFLTNEKAQWSTQKALQERIIQEALNRSNEQNQKYQKEIHRLKQQLKGTVNIEKGSD